MQLLFNGITLGLGMSVLAGPILFLYLQLGVERGFRAGAMLGLGAWLSDLFFLVGAYLGVSYLLELTAWDGFRLYTGLLGGALLILLGGGILWNRHAPTCPAKADQTDAFEHTYTGLCLKGFFINTLNPFAVFFWLGVVGSASQPRTLDLSEACLLLGGILGTIIITDLGKILLARHIRQWMKRAYLIRLRLVSGVMLVVLGIVLVVRVVM